MNAFSTFTAAVALGLLGACASLRARDEICDGQVRFVGNREFKVNENAEKLTCGDPKYPSWREIPPPQQELMLRGLLVKEGFHRPSFKLEKDILLVDAGARSRVRELRFLDAPDEFFEYRPPQFEGRPLNSGVLDDIEKWSFRRLHETGYPCADVKVLASLEDEKVLVKLVPGRKRVFPETLDFSQDELARPVENRYRAFFPGERFEYSLLKLSSSRMEIDGVTSRSTYDEDCSPDIATEAIPIAHRTSLGPARSVQIGFGFSTEEYFLTRMSWKNHRVGRQASLLGATLRASFIQQQGTLFANQYLSERYPRWYFAPKIDFKHVNEKDQKYSRATVPALIGWDGDARKGRLIVEAGPKFFYEKVDEGPIVGKKKLLLGDTQWTWQSHDYEINLSRPMQGYELMLETSSIIHSLRENARVHHAAVSGTLLWNLGKVDPARWVLGLRGRFESVFRDRTDSSLAAAPIEYFTWLGGEESVRGFGRKELPLDRNGALSSAYLGTELRGPNYFGENFDPLILFDAGMLGSDSEFRLDHRIFYSPGLGMRYQSPIGSVRVTGARGFVPNAKGVEKEHEHLQIFLSLGREF